MRRALILTRQLIMISWKYQPLPPPQHLQNAFTYRLKDWGLIILEYYLLKRYTGRNRWLSPHAQAARNSRRMPPLKCCHLHFKGRGFRYNNLKDYLRVIVTWYSISAFSFLRIFIEQISAMIYALLAITMPSVISAIFWLGCSNARVSDYVERLRVYTHALY